MKALKIYICMLFLVLAELYTSYVFVYTSSCESVCGCMCICVYGNVYVYVCASVFECFGNLVDVFLMK